eukprot:TRINITY_DN107947_c0_g1_i1.p1 TRINITY_DN107947_c0_g1~~TRINITY_DN107947_c0_g1_i1.p1  ORF type:complete len:275 (-),score=62.71 TRINITY_DN107947_c0_g1_i1:50-766(-)
MHRERSELWKQSGNFMTGFNQITVHEDGSAEIIGPACSFQKPSSKVLVFSVRTLSQNDNALAESLRGQILHLQRESFLKASVVVPPGTVMGTFEVEGELVFFRPQESTLRGEEHQIAGLGNGGRLKLSCKAGKLVLSQVNKVGRPKLLASITEPQLLQSGFDKAEAAFQAVALLAMAGCGSAAEEVNLNEAFTRLRDGLPLPAIAKTGVRLQKGEMAVIQARRHMRVTFSHEFRSNLH